jgi:hypothetical protein
MPKVTRIKQITVESTEAVRQKLAQLEEDLVDDKARNYEIVGVLIKRAKASQISTAALHTYRTELRLEREYAHAVETVASFIKALSG